MEKNEKRKKGRPSLRTLICILAFLIVFALSCVLFPVFAVFLAITAVVALVLSFIVIKVFSLNDDDEAEDKTAENETSADDFTLEKCIQPAVLTDKEGNILSFSKGFSQMFETEGKENIGDIFNGIDLTEGVKTFGVNQRFYDVQCFDRGGKIFAAVSDATERELLKRNAENQLVSAGYIYIDNYEEVFSSVESSVAPILTAVIDDKLNSHISKLGGAIKKFEKDRYVFMLNKASLDNEIESRFEILNIIRETKVSDHMPVTLSIGVGISRKNMAEAMKSAKEAIDLAMGRGGDQAVIKNEEGYQFFGGKSGEVSHNARVRARVKAEALKNLILESDKVYVTGHKRPDFDSLGASVGIYSIASSLGKECHIIMGPLTAAVKNVYDKFAQNSEYEGMFVTEAEAVKQMSRDSMLVIADTHVKSLVECENALPLFEKTVIFDHHRKSTEFIDNAVLTYHEPYASSASELITEMIRHLGSEVKLKPIEADALLAGIVVDTKNFGIKAGAVTFEAAAFLRRSGADSTRVRYLFKNDLELFKLKAEAVKRAEIYRSGIIVSYCDSYGENSNILAAQTADDLLNVTGIRASVVLCRNEGRVFVSARSYGDVNVQLMLEKIGGGGHLTMAGVQMEDGSIEEAMNKIKEAIDRYIEEEE